MLGNIGFSGLVLILVVLLIFFGPSKLPEIGKAFGKSLREFKNATNGLLDESNPAKETQESNVQTASRVEPIQLKEEEAK